MSQKQLTLTENSVPFDDSWDVIVAGAGPAGSAAAVAAARAGAKTLVIEAMGFAGGMGTAGLIPAWCPFSNGKEVIYKGIAEEIFKASKDGISHIAPDATEWVPIDPEHLKRAYDKILVEASVKPLFFSTVVGVETDGAGSVTAVIVANKGGISAFGAKVFIDCTGDADLAVRAGAEYEKGDENGGMQAATHCFSLGGVSEYSYRHGPYLHPHNTESPAYDIRDDDEFPLVQDQHMCNNIIGANTVGFNSGHLWGVDGTSAESLTQAMIKGREQVRQIHAGLKKYCPAGFANSFVNATGSLMGIRETRRVICDYTLTADDYMQRRSFDDEICRNSYFIDVHRTNKEDVPKKSVRNNDHSHRYSPGESHGVPYSCMTPKGLKNVIVAGRSVSSDRAVNGSVRVMPVCLAMGQAAGEAAAMAANGDCDFHNVDTHKLRENLRENGAYLP